MEDFSIYFRFLLATFTCFRLAQLIAMDDGPFHVFDRFRHWLENNAAIERTNNKNDGRYSTLAQFFNCPYCLGVWVALFTGYAVLFPNFYTDLILIWFGIAGVQTFLQDKE